MVTLMYALISPNEKRGNFFRVAELSKEPFDVASPLFWVAAPVGTTLDGHAYDPATQSFVAYVPDSEQGAEEFKPWDVKATIPSEQVAAEAERQKIRDKYAAMQDQIETLTAEVAALKAGA